MSRRIFLTIVAVAVAAVVLFGVPLAIAVERRNEADAALELHRVGNAATSQLPVDVSDGRATLPVVEPQIHVALYDRDGRILVGTGPPTADPIVQAVTDAAVHEGFSHGERVVATPVVRAGQVVGALRSSEPANEASGRTHRAWLVMAGLASAIIGLAAAAAALLSRHLTRPVQRLRDAAVRLGDGDFTVTAPTCGVPELDAAASALSSTARRVGQLVDRERAFTVDAAHQLRTPLASLRLGLEGELARPRPDPTMALRAGLHDVDRLEATVEDLLALARDTATDRQALDLAALVGTRTAHWAATLASAGRAIRVDADPATPHVRLSATALATVLDVLVDNAVHHGRGTITIGIAPAAAGGARITVADEGRLAAPPPSLFERRSPSASGHGIGLALARSLALAEGARLQLGRTVPTTFEILIAVPTAHSVDPVNPAPLRPGRPWS